MSNIPEDLKLPTVTNVTKTEVWPYTPLFHNYECKGKKSRGKSIPLQDWTGTESSRRLRLPDFKTLGT
jgi:hypothetical protein